MNQPKRHNYLWFITQFKGLFYHIIYKLIDAVHGLIIAITAIYILFQMFPFTGPASLIHKSICMKWLHQSELHCSITFPELNISASTDTYAMDLLLLCLHQLLNSTHSGMITNL